MFYLLFFLMFSFIFIILQNLINIYHILINLRKRKSRIAPDSDGEELAATPPPSPEAGDDNKRRSARNTHRKKYVDDVMLRFSDDDVPLQDSQLSKKVEGTNTAKPVSVKKDSEGGEVGPNKPNFVYIVCIMKLLFIFIIYIIYIFIYISYYTIFLLLYIKKL